MPTPTSAPGAVVIREFYRAYDFPIPADFMDIDAAVEQQESNDEIRGGIAAARARLATILSLEKESISTMRLRRGMSQKQLAAAIGTSQPHIARIEAGRDNVLLKTANLLATALGVTLADVNRALGYT
jgi:DNA-binding XRE family transcriptional regulator